MSEALLTFERRVVAVQAAWADHNYGDATTAEQITAFVTQYKDEEILQARRVLQKAFQEYRRFVRGLQDVYDKMKAKETRRWGGSTAAIALDQSLLTKHLQEWDGTNPPEEFGMCYELNDFLNVDEPVAIKTMLDQLVYGAMQTAAYKKQLKVMASHMKQSKLPYAVAAILDKKGRNELHKIITQHCPGGKALLAGWKADPKTQTATVCELQSWRHDCRQFSVGPLPYCAPEARIVMAGGEMVLGFSVSELPGDSLKAKMAFLHGLSLQRAIEVARRGGIIAKHVFVTCTLLFVLCFLYNCHATSNDHQAFVAWWSLTRIRLRFCWCPRATSW